MSKLSVGERMRAYLQLVATGPELSKSLDQQQAEDAVTMILAGEIDPVQSGIFLIALRMKRETDAENIGALNALCQSQTSQITNLDDVMAIADPFNGFVRGATALPFLPAVLAACGLPSYCHGVMQAGPKYGVTPHLVLRAAGKQVGLAVADGARYLEDPDIGWCYLDQAETNPLLHSLVPLRNQMVKRTCLSTLEVVLKPLGGKLRSHLLTGFVHKAYPPVYAALARHAGFDTAAIVRGVEGGCIPSLSQLSRYFGFSQENEMALYKLAPADIGIDQSNRMIPLSEAEESVLARSTFNSQDLIVPVVERNVNLGMDALDNQPGPMLDSLVYGAAIALNHTGKVNSLAAGAEAARIAVSSGDALRRFNAAE